MTLFGIQIFPDSYCKRYEERQYRWPKSKRVRIRKKFAKKYRRTEAIPTYFRLSETMIVCHPSIMEKLRKEIARRSP